MTEQKQGILSRVTSLLHRLEDSFLIALLTTMIVLAITQITLRNIFDTGLDWIDPSLRLLVLWVGMAGAMVATRQDHHITVDVFSRSLSTPVRLAVRVFTDLFTCLVSGMIAYHAVRLVLMDKEAESIAFASLPGWVAELVLPVAFGVIALRYLRFAVVHSRQLLTSDKS